MRLHYLPILGPRHGAARGRQKRRRNMSGMTLRIIIAAVLVLYFIMIYNRLVALRNNVDEAWSNIDVLLKQRYEEIPKLVEVCKQYMKHERETLDADPVLADHHHVAAAGEGDDVDPLWRQRGSLAVVSIARGPDLTRNGV